MKSPALIFGTLDASLPRAQTQVVLDKLSISCPGVECEITTPDPCKPETENTTDSFLAFNRDDVDILAKMIRSGKCRAVVAQASDLPVPLPEGIKILCVPDRATPFDAFLNRQGLITDELEPGSRIGVLCLRAKNHLQSHWPDLDFSILPGGVDRAMETHMRRSEIDGLVLPSAVTEYLGIQGIVSEIFSPEFLLPAPGQGALVILGSALDAELAGLLSPLHSEPSAHELTAEFAFRSHMVSDMDLPLGVLARIEDSELSIIGTTGCGTNRVAVHGKVSEAEEIGDGLAQQLLSSPESFVNLLEAEFSDGMPPEEEDDFDSEEQENEDQFLEKLMKEEALDDDPEIDYT